MQNNVYILKSQHYLTLSLLPLADIVVYMFNCSLLSNFVSRQGIFVLELMDCYCTLALFVSCIIKGKKMNSEIFFYSFDGRNLGQSCNIKGLKCQKIIENGSPYFSLENIVLLA